MLSGTDRGGVSPSESDREAAPVRNGSGGDGSDEQVESGSRASLRIRRRARTKKKERSGGMAVDQKRIGAKTEPALSALTALPSPDKEAAKRNAAVRYEEASVDVPRVRKVAAVLDADGVALSEKDREHGSLSESNKEEAPCQEKTAEAEVSSQPSGSSEKYFSSFRNPQSPQSSHSPHIQSSHPRLSARDAGVSLIQRRQKRTGASTSDIEAAHQGVEGLESASDNQAGKGLTDRLTLYPDKDHQPASLAALPSSEPVESNSERSVADDLEDQEAMKREFNIELGKMMLRPLHDYDVYGHPILRYRKEIDRDYHLGTEAAHVHDDTQLQEIADRYNVSWGRVVWNRARRLDESLITAAVGVEWHCMFELFSNYADSLHGYLTVEEIVRNIQDICTRYYQAVHGVVPVADAKRLALLSYEIIETALSIPAFRRKMCENAVSVEHQLVVEAVKQLMVPDSATFTLDVADTFHASAFWRKDMEPTEEDAKAVRDYWNGIQGFADSAAAPSLSVEATKSHNSGASGLKGETVRRIETSSSGSV